MWLKRAHERALARVGRLPRTACWALGAAIAFSGALIARLIAEQLPAEQRVAVWLAGGAVIFIGLAVLSLGSRPDPDARPDVPADAASTTVADGEAAEASAAARMVEQLTAKEEGTRPPGEPRAPPAGNPKAGGAGEGNRTLA